MAGALTASATRGTARATYAVTLRGDTVEVRSDAVVRPAVELWRLRRALARTPAGGRRLGVPVRVRLGLLPPVTVRA
mgnify:CR=1 FL=1